MNLSDKILKLRKKKDLSQEELAEKLNISRQAISRWEMGSSQPDGSNILQLSKLFGVTADYLLNDEYESDYDVPVVKETKKAGKVKIKRIIGLCISGVGFLGNFVIYIISRMVKVVIPRITYSKTGEKWYTWSNEFKANSYKYFIQEYSLELLTTIFWFIAISGLIVAFVRKEKLKTTLNMIKDKANLKKTNK